MKYQVISAPQWLPGLAGVGLLPSTFQKEKIAKSSFSKLPRCSQAIVQNHCQVKLGSTDSMSVKKSILDGRLLPRKSVLIPGLICDQRLLQNDMPLVRKRTCSMLEIGWKYVSRLTHSFSSFSRQRSGCGSCVNQCPKPGPFSKQNKKKIFFKSPMWIGSSLQAIVGKLLQMCSVKANAFVWKVRLSWVF